jgi:hypothetical protein
LKKIGTEQMKRHHRAVIEFEIEREAGLEPVLVGRGDDASAEIGSTGLFAALDPQERFDRSGVRLGPADAERADVVEKEVHPVFRGEQDERVDTCAVQICGEPLESCAQVVALSGRRGFGPRRDARCVAHRGGENDRHQASPRIARR